jgi:hypothetical protein
MNNHDIIALTVFMLLPFGFVVLPLWFSFSKKMKNVKRIKHEKYQQDLYYKFVKDFVGPIYQDVSLHRFINFGDSIEIAGLSFIRATTISDYYDRNVYIDPTHSYLFALTQDNVNLYWITPSINITQDEFLSGLKKVL